MLCGQPRLNPTGAWPVRPEQKFWNWFEKHQDKFFDFEVASEENFDRLLEQLHKVHPALTFEFGPRGARREFVISAGGLKGAFPSVTALVAAAPRLDRWRITGFRPRCAALSRIQIGDTCVDPNDVEFSLLTRGAEIGIRLFIPSYGEDYSILKQIGYLMLDDALGEYDVEARVSLIQFLPHDASKTEKRYPLSELPALFDRLVAQLDGPPTAVSN